MTKENIYYKLPGIFISQWDSGTVFRAPCFINPRNNEVFDIMNVGHPADDDNLTTEMIEIDGIEYPVTNIDEILDLCDTDDVKDQFTDIAKNRQYWYSHSGKDLHQELKELQ